MMQRRSFYTKPLFLFHSLLILIFMSLWILLPMSRVQVFLTHALRADMYRIESLLPFFFCFGVLLSVLLRVYPVAQLLGSWHLPSQLKLAAIRWQSMSLLWTRKKTGILLLLAVMVFLRAFFDVDLPLELDELQQGAKFLYRPFFISINPTYSTEIHAVGHFLSILSLKLFGVSKFSLRLPSLVFAVIFLFVLFKFLRQFCSPWVGVLVLGHLLMNPHVIWYLHSARGYASSLCVAMGLIFLFTQRLSLRHQPAPKFNEPSILFLLLLAPFLHSFMIIFSSILLTSFGVWVWSKRTSVLGVVMKSHLRLLLRASLFLPLYFGVMLFVGLSLKEVGDFGAGSFPSWETEVLNLFAIGRVWWGKALVAWGLGLLCYRMLNGKISSTFSSSFVIIFVTFYLVVLEVMEVDHLHTRWFLPFLIPLLFWFASLTQHLESPFAAMSFQISLLVLLVVGPAYFYAEGKRMLVEPYEKHAAFVEIAKQKMGPLEKQCVYFPEASTDVQWTRIFHFSQAMSQNQWNPRCQNHYTLLFGLGVIKGKATQGFSLVYREGQYGLFKGVYEVAPSMAPQKKPWPFS